MTTGQPLGIDALHSGCGRTLLEQCEELIERVLVTLGHDLDTVVLPVAYIAL